MRKVIIDEEDNIIYSGADAGRFLALSTLPIEELTEDDELRFGSIIYNLGNKKLRFRIEFDVEFKGVDSWSRPVFKDIDSSLYFGSVTKLMGSGDTRDTIIDYFRENQHELEYFGTSFDCEPHGGRNSNIKLNVL